MAQQEPSNEAQRQSGSYELAELDRDFLLASPCAACVCTWNTPKSTAAPDGSSLSQFYSLYTHDNVRIASCVPHIRVANVFANLDETLALAEQANALKAAITIFPELGLSAYAIDDLLFQEALLDAVVRAIDHLIERSRQLFPMRIVGTGSSPTRHTPLTSPTK